MSRKYQVAKAELWERLRETTRHMQRSCDAYDAGDTAEARRLANELRKLFKQKRDSKALLHQVGLLHTISFLDSCGEILEGALNWMHPMVGFNLTTGGGGPPTSKFIPLLGHGTPSNHRQFSQWWGRTIILYHPKQIRISRCDLVLEVAETDSGTHADSSLEDAYAALSREDEGHPRLYQIGGPHAGDYGVARGIELAHLRQIAYEVLETLRGKAPQAFSGGPKAHPQSVP